MRKTKTKERGGKGRKGILRGEGREKQRKGEEAWQRRARRGVRNEKEKATNQRNGNI